MALSTGTHLGPYEILAALGAGGMGEVYRARDTRLDRTVAVKILPSTNPDLKARFEREAKAIAALTHPHICTVYDVGHHGDTDYLVMECLEGETLAARLQRGALPIADALRYAIEMASALDKAHRAGIVHRDLKPANIILTKEGAKLVDFGLATLRTPAAQGAVAGLTTVLPDRRLTEKGTILGTIQYMAPEQVEGQQTEARTDIFAFGALLYEMLTGQRAFEGGSPASLIAAILRATPPPISARQPLVSPALEHVVAVCLAKDPDERWQTAADLRRELNWIGVDASRADSPISVSMGRRGWRLARIWALSVVLVVTALGIAGWIWTPSRVATPRAVTRSVIAFPPGTRLSVDSFRSAVAISPDGRTIVFAADEGSGPQLYVRPMDALAATPIAGTRGAAAPFFSPDGQWVGFWADDLIQKVALSGGAPQVIGETGFVAGAWGDDGMILFSDRPTTGLSRVSANGGTPEIATIPDRDRREKSHRSPSVLPGGKAAIMTVGSADISSFDDARIELLNLATGERRMLIQGGMAAQYLSSGHLLYARAGSLLTVPFDVDRLEVTGPPVAIVADVFMQPDFGIANFAVSRDGSLLYAPGGAQAFQTTLVWVDRQGRRQPVTDLRRAFDGVSLSPDGQRIALQIDQATVEVWVYDLVRATFTRLAHGWDNGDPIWSPDGGRVTFSLTGVSPQGRNLLSRPADGSGSAERVTTDVSAVQTPGAWSPDGKLLVFTQYNGRRNADLWVWSNGERTSRPLLQTPASELQARISPDGRWIAYQSNQSGRFEVYVQAFPGSSRNWQVSLDGGTLPVWARNGRELFYRNGNLMMAVDVSTTPGFAAGRPKQLFEGSDLQDSYDVARDGRFLMIRSEVRPVTQLNLVQNWIEELKQRTRR